MPIKTTPGLNPFASPNGGGDKALADATAAQQAQQRAIADPFSVLSGTSGAALARSLSAEAAFSTDQTNEANAAAKSKSDSAFDQRARYTGHGDNRDAQWSLTTDLWQAQPGGRVINLHAGPSSAAWTIALRASEEPTASGHARFAKARSTSFQGSAQSPTYFDLPKLDLHFQSGNIMPRRGTGFAAVAEGLGNFYDFLELLNQPPLIPAPFATEGNPNYVNIYYHSLLFPNLVLKGYFDPSGISFTNDAQDPAKVEWSCPFTVYEQSPTLWDSGALKDEATTFF
jgi:hypothetical protein